MDSNRDEGGTFMFTDAGQESLEQGEEIEMADMETHGAGTSSVWWRRLRQDGYLYPIYDSYGLCWCIVLILWNVCVKC